MEGEVFTQLSGQEEEVYVLTEAEKDERQRALLRSNATAHKGMKRPRVIEYEEEEVDGDVPDLAKYFDEFSPWDPIDNLDRIKMCRAYASYLASLQRKVKK